MRKKIYILIAVVLTVLILVPMMGCRAEEVGVGKEPVKIGFALATTGPFSYDGLLELEALNLAVERINAKGGILGGRMIEGVLCDHAYVTENAVTAVNKLIYDDKVDAIIGLEDTALIWAAEDIMHQAEIPYVEFGGNPPGWPEAADVGAFRIGFVVDQMVDGFFRWAAEDMDVKSMVVVGIDTTFIVDSYEFIFVPFAEKYGIELEPLIVYPVGAPDFMPQYTKGVAYNTDMLWGTNFFNSEIPREITAIKELGYEGLYAMIFDIPTETIIEPVKEAAEGAYIPFMTYPFDDNPAMTEFREAFMERTGLPPHYWTSNAWQAFHALVYGMEAAGVTGKGDLAAIDAGIKSAAWTDLQGHKATWTEHGALVYGDVVLAQVRDGKFIKIATLQGASPPADIYGEILPPGTVDVGAK